MNTYSDVKMEFEKIWGARDKETLQSQKYVNIVQISEMVFEALQPVSDKIFGTNGPIYKSYGTFNLSMHKRLLKGNSIGSLDIGTLKKFESVLLRSFQLGLRMYHLNSTFPTREKIPQIDFESLYGDWSESAMISDRKMQLLDKQTGQTLSNFFKTWYDNEVDAFFMNELGLGVWKRGRAGSWLSNLYFSGMFLGLLADVASKKI